MIQTMRVIFPWAIALIPTTTRLNLALLLATTPSL